MNENDRLLKLLEYSKEAIAYWFDMCDVPDETIKENEHFQDECDYFIEKLKNNE